MAHFAKLNDNNTVISVIVVNNATIDNLSFPESESVGLSFLAEWSEGYSNWKQTSYNSKFRKNYAGIGYIYDVDLDAFIPPKPYPSWLLNTTICDWEAPVPYPQNGKPYAWDEQTQSWIEIPHP